MDGLLVTRLLQNPLGHVPPAGERGDIVRVTDGISTIYLTPETFDATSEYELRKALLTSPRSSSASRPPRSR